MQTLNVLIVGSGIWANRIQQSKYLNKLYITSEEEMEDAYSIRFNTFKGLVDKCKKLQIDIVLVEEEKWVLEGIANVMKKNYVNCFSVTTEWTNLALSHSYARKMLEKYNINTPPIITLPVEFPILVKGNGIMKIANSIQDIISIKESSFNTSPEISKTIYLEKYLNGEKQKVISLFDGKHLLTFPNKNIDKNLLNEYSKKLETMLIKENAKFTGFINSDIIKENNILYNTGFSFGFRMPDSKFLQEQDILYICLSALYQKLNEIEI